MARKLDEILAEIEDNERIRDIELETVPPKARPGVEGRKRDAEGILENLRKEHKNAIKEKSCYIFLKGEKQDEFAGIANEELDAIVIEANQLYKNIADKAFQLVDQKGRFSVNNVQEVVELIRNEVRGTGVVSMPPPAFESDYFVRSPEEMKSIVTDALRRVVADDLNLHYIEMQVAKRALDTGYNNEVVCVIVTGATDEEIGGLQKLGAGVATLSTPNNPNKSNVNTNIVKIVRKFKGVEPTPEVTTTDKE